MSCGRLVEEESKMTDKEILKKQRLLKRQIQGIKLLIIKKEKELKLLQAQCPHTGVEWKAIAGGPYFWCLICGKYETN
jgi:hypothetical protein